MKTQELLKENREQILRISRTHGAIKLSLFGSAAREEDNENSDIDFLVEFDEGRTLFDLIRLKQELEELLGKSVDIVTEKAVHPLLKKQIKIEAIEL